MFFFRTFFLYKFNKNSNLYRVHRSNSNDKHFFFYKHKYITNLRYRFSFYYSFFYFLNKILGIPLIVLDHVSFFYSKIKSLFFFLRFFILYFFLIITYLKRINFKKDSFFFSHFFSFFFFFSSFFFIKSNFSFFDFSLIKSSFLSFCSYGSLFFFRHFFFSFFSWSLFFYHFYKYIFSSSNTFFFFSFSELEPYYKDVNSFINLFKQNMSFVSFLFKFFYLSILHSFFFRFGTSGVLSDTFFFFLFRFFSNNLYNNLISSIISFRYVRNSFFSFLSGRYSSRLFFFFFRFNTQIHIYFFFWLLYRYNSLYLNILFLKLKDDFFFFFLISLSNHNNISFFSLFLKFSSLFFSKQSFFSSFRNMFFHSFSFLSFFFSSYKRFFISSLVSFHFFSFVLNCESFKWHFFFYRKCLLNFTYQLEASLFSYSNVPHFFFINFYENTTFYSDINYLYKRKVGYYNNLVPPITSAKILCDYIVVMLSLGLKIKQIFSSILDWQTYWQNTYDRQTFRFVTKYSVNLGDFIYPLKGIRIICSGPTYKARRTTALKYHLWVSDEFLTGRMPLSTMDLSIDYYQSVAVIRRSNIGVKVWLLFDNVL